MTENKLKWLDLFSGIGMYAKGLEEAGHEVIGFCEVDKFCHKILKKHWPMKPVSWSIELLNKALMESSEDSRARILAQQEKSAGYNGTPPEMPQPVQDCSGRWLTPFAWLDLDTGSWRTWQSCLIDTLGLYSERWPPSGMMQNGIAWQRQPLAHPTIADGFTYLPTPMAEEGAGCSRKRYRGSPNFRGTRTAEGLRTSYDCPKFLNPSFAEALMGLPKDFTLLETEILPALSEN